MQLQFLRPVEQGAKVLHQGFFALSRTAKVQQGTLVREAKARSADENRDHGEQQNLPRQIAEVDQAAGDHGPLHGERRQVHEQHDDRIEILREHSDRARDAMPLQTGVGRGTDTAHDLHA